MFFFVVLALSFIVLFVRDKKKGRSFFRYDQNRYNRVRPAPRPSYSIKTQYACCPYEPVGTLMTPAEQKVFEILYYELGDKYYITPQIRLGSLLKVKNWMHSKDYHLSLINQKSVDYVLMSPYDYSPRLVIELDDSTHMMPSRIKRDEFVNYMLREAGIGVVRIPIHLIHSPQSVIDLVTDALVNKGIETIRSRGFGLQYT